MGNIKFFRKPEEKPKKTDTSASPVQTVHMLPVDRIIPNPNQPRKTFDDTALFRLAESIRQYGILQPLTVRHIIRNEKEMPLAQSKTGEISLVSERVYNPKPQAEKPPFYEVIAGERRLRAAVLAGLSEVPCLFSDVSDSRSAELAIVENIQREDLNIFEEAEAIAQLIRSCSLTQEQAAARVGKSRPAVANALRLLALPEDVRSLVEKGELSAGHARAVLSLPTPARQRAAAQKILTLRLSVRQAEAMCKRLAAEEKKPEPAKRPAVNYIAECEKALTRRLDRKVRIVSGKRKGRFELEFYGEEDLQRLYEALLALDPSEETHGK